METDGPDRVTFELERFAWGAPDRLELSGKFAGLRGTPGEAPVLVVRSADRTHRLPAVPDSVSGAPESGRRWQAQFAWQEAPAPFEVAELEIGSDIVVQLPQPGAKRRPFRHPVLDVQRADAERARDGAGEGAVPGAGAERLRLQSELLAAQEEASELRAALQRTEEELTRARADLESERERHAADAERFRAGLAKVQEAAEQALAVEQSASQQLGSDLREAHEAIEAKDAAVADLQGRLEAAAAAHTQAETDARAQIDALRERVAALEQAGEEADRLRTELEQARKQAEDARAELEPTRAAAEEARDEAERLLGRLTTIRDTLSDGR